VKKSPAEQKKYYVLGVDASLNAFYPLSVLVNLCKFSNPK
jgi:hypothetical protein